MSKRLRELELEMEIADWRRQRRACECVSLTETQLIYLVIYACDYVSVSCVVCVV